MVLVDDDDDLLAARLGGASLLENVGHVVQSKGRSRLDELCKDGKHQSCSQAALAHSDAKREAHPLP